MARPVRSTSSPACSSRAGGQRVEWTRDPVDVYAFHVNVPQGVTQLDVDFQFLSPTEQREGRIVVTPDMLNVEWNAVVLYPAGYFSRDITFAPSIRVPDGWKIAHRAGDREHARRGDAVQADHAEHPGRTRP